jgi:predicted phosphodiesterase
MRCAVVSDIHGNWDALEAVLADARNVDQVWCLGDIVDMGPQPNECVDALRARGATCIYGNHEEWVIGPLPSHFQGGMMEEWTSWTWDQLSLSNQAFLKELPEQVTLGDFTLLHYPHRSYDPPGVEDLDRFSARYCLVGHTHLPLVCSYATSKGRDPSVAISRPPANQPVLIDADRAIVNVGSVGSSLHEPNLACYTLIEEPEDGGPATFTFRAVPFPVQRLMDHLRDCGISPQLTEGRRLGKESRRQARVGDLYLEWYPECASPSR